MELESSLLAAPYENLSKLFRNAHHLIEKEMAQLVTSVNELNSKKASISKSDAAAGLDKMLTRLRALKKKLEESKREEEVFISHCAARAAYLKEVNGVDIKEGDNEAVRRWLHLKTERVLVDYMLREGLYDSAAALASDANIQALVDLEMFTSARKVIDSFNSGKCAEGLKWCNDNRSKLKKVNSTLEFNLRVQEFVELLRVNKHLEAVTYARKFFPAFVSTHLPQIQHAMAALAFHADTPTQRYSHLFSAERWRDLVAQFEHDNYAVHGQTPDPQLQLLLRYGLQSLKTWQCYDKDNQQISCPVCQPSLRLLAQDIPFAHHTNSSLVCRITGEPMNDNNPPYVLPNGYAYSRKALMEMASRNGGVVTCPQTRQTFKIEEARKAFIM